MTFSRRIQVKNDSERKVNIFDYDKRLIRGLNPGDVLELPMPGVPDPFGGRFDKITYTKNGVEVKESKSYQKPAGWTIDFSNETNDDRVSYPKENEFFIIFKNIPRTLPVRLSDKDIIYKEIIFRNKKVVTLHPTNPTARYEFVVGEVVKVKRSDIDLERIRREIIAVGAKETEENANSLLKRLKL